MRKYLLTLLSVFCVLFAQAQTKPKGIKTGSTAPSFMGVDQNGKKIELKKLLDKGPVVLFFYRGTWCPYCQKQVASLQKSLDKITAKGASVVAVTPSSGESIEKMIEKQGGIGFHILHDDGHKIMDDYDLTYPVKETMQKRFAKMGLDFNKINGKNGPVLPIPATYVIDQKGKIVFAHFDPNFKKRPSVSEILQHLPKPL
ncbi:hypothetical protein FUAX_35520 [Fulvitalea axinellae]|uniref:thioredoxin-dependent peroxiredoxin n=1 Tax=Fulvitalea axinellae TaxID=1182444 RepID=A0AAU9CP15_9BACT|nr:hypothetical protein FUAX_35520 [Fulvitalea axinellae]